MLRDPVSTAPASKSIQCGFFAAISLFDETLMVGTGNPSGVPRPVVNSSTVAPLTTIAVDDTPSFPGDSSNDSPWSPTGSPYRSTRDTGARPPFWIAPSDFSSSVVRPPALLPGDGFSYTGWPCRMK